MHLTLILLPTQPNPTHPTLKQAESIIDKGMQRGGLAAKSLGRKWNGTNSKDITSPPSLRDLLYSSARRVPKNHAPILDEHFICLGR